MLAKDVLSSIPSNDFLTVLAVLVLIMVIIAALTTALYFFFRFCHTLLVGEKDNAKNIAPVETLLLAKDEIRKLQD